MTVVLAARALAATGDARGVDKLRERTKDADQRARQEAVLALGEAAEKGSREVVTQRLQDDSVAVRASAIYALARIAGPSAVPALRQAAENALTYERQLEAQRPSSIPEDAWRSKYGMGEFDLRETLQEAITEAQSAR